MKQKNVTLGGTVHQDSQTKKTSRTETRVVKRTTGSKVRKEVYNG